MKEHVDRFLRYLGTERGASEHTVRSYKKDLDSFAQFVGQKVEDVDMADVRGYVAMLINSGLKKSSVGRRLAAVRSFFKFLHRYL